MNNKKGNFKPGQLLIQIILSFLRHWRNVRKLLCGNFFLTIWKSLKKSTRGFVHPVLFSLFIMCILFYNFWKKKMKFLQFIAMIRSTKPELESKLSSMRVMDNNPQKPVVRMANLCVVSSHTVWAPFFVDQQTDYIVYPPNPKLLWEFPSDSCWKAESRKLY
mgnify:CR=1 FL=1